MRTTLFAAALLLCLGLDAAAQSPSPAKPAQTLTPGPSPKGEGRMPANHPPIGGSPHSKEAASPWAEFADYALSIKVPPKGESGNWKIRAFADPADVLVEYDTPAAKGRNRGTVLLVGGQTLAARGTALEPGFELEPLDAAVVSLKILTRLLDAAAPGGPAALKAKQSVSARDDKAPIEAFTPTVSSRIAAPWSLKGTLARVDASTVSFDLEFEAPFGEKGETRARWRFSGTASGSARSRRLEDGMSLAGWSGYSIGPGTSGKTGHASLRFRATKLPGPFATLKDLRAAAAKGG